MRGATYAKPERWGRLKILVIYGRGAYSSDVT